MTAKHRIGTHFHSSSMTLMLRLNNPAQAVFLCAHEQTTISLAKHQVKLLTHIQEPEDMKHLGTLEPYSAR